MRSPIETENAQSAVSVARALLVAFPLVILACHLWDARPYWVFETDSEADYYTNALLILENGVPRGFLHPGTPIYYLAAAIVGFVGRGVVHTQACLTVAQVVVTLATSVSVWFATRRGSGVTGVALLLGVGAFLGFPSVVTHFNYFGSDPFVPVIGVPLVVAAWSALRPVNVWDWRRLRWVAFGVGVALAIKLTFVPFALAFFGGAAVVLAQEARRPRTAGRDVDTSRVRWFFAHAVGLLARALAAFVLFTLPALPRLPATILGTLSRGDVAPRGNLLVALATSGRVMLTHAPTVAVLMFAMAVATGVVMLLHLRANRRVDLIATDRAAPAPDELPRLVFLGLLWLGLVYAFASAARDAWRGWDPGLLFRNATPCALVVIPTGLLLASRVQGLGQPWRRAGEPAVPRGAWLSAWMIATQDLRRPQVLAMCLLAILAPGSVAHLLHRHDVTVTRSAQVARTRATLAAVAHGPIALWDSVGDLGGAAAFHHWGNYRYGADQFSAELLRAFPHQGFFRLREIRRIARGAVAGGPPGAAVRRGLRLWSRLFPGTFRQLSDDLVAGQRQGFRPALIAFPLAARPELGATTTDELRALLERAFGPTVASVRLIGTQRFFLFSIDDRTGTRLSAH